MGQGTQRTALLEAMRVMLGKRGCWNEMGDTVIPSISPVTDSSYWQAAGALLALSLLAGENICPVSPVVIYALLCNVHVRRDPRASMDLSLGFLEKIEISKAKVLLPWMVIPPGQDWRTLPEGHIEELRILMDGLGIDVSIRYLSYALRVTAVLQERDVSSSSVESHAGWTGALVTAAMLGATHFFSTVQFEYMLKGFRQLIELDDGWDQVGLATALE